jgi:hypothetical protein
VAFVIASLLPAAAAAGPLTYQNINLQSSFGLYKSSGLPSNPGTSLFGLTEVTGFQQFPDNIPANTVIFFPIEEEDWADGTFDSTGHKVPGVAGITSNAILVRATYVYPNALQLPNPHIRLVSDLVLPFVNAHVNLDNNSGSGLGGGSIGDILWCPLGALFTGHELNHTQFSAFLGLYFGLPSGSYSANNQFNIGSNQYSATLYTNEVFTFTNLNNLFVDLQMHYTKVLRGNNDFMAFASPDLTKAITGQPISSYKNGDVFDANVDALYPVTKNLAIGPSFSILDQVTNDTWNGTALKNDGEFGMAAGFGAQYRFPMASAQVKYLRSFDVRNMPAYNMFIAKLVIPFFL